MSNPQQPRQQMPQAERGFRQVPRPPMNQQQPAAQNAGQRGGYSPANKPARNGEEMAPAYRTVPRPPEKGNGSQPGFRSFGSPQGQPHSVAQPPAQENRPQPGFRSFGSPQGQPHSVPQPSANTGNGNRYGRTPQAQNEQPRNQGNQPNAGSGRFNGGGNQGGPVARPNNPRPTPEPARVERQTPRSEVAPSGGREVRSHESNSPPPQHNQNSKDESKPDKKH